MLVLRPQMITEAESSGRLRSSDSLKRIYAMASRYFFRDQ
jgi:hypothetical protein